jgi:anhydro-N-acetylmuramic acid kinase
MSRTYKAIGLMSGTSMDGVDLALIESDGKKIIKHLNFTYQPYQKDFKEALNKVIYDRPSLEKIKLVEKQLTLIHADLVNNFLTENKINPKEIDVVAFHGHTILHNPDQRITWQIGNSGLLSHLTGINVISDFRTRDVALGGQGAPLVPIFHFHLFAEHKRPTAILNIGGISNITYFNSENEEEIKAFDICFGNAPLDDLMRKKLGRDFDQDGEVAKKGTVDFLLADRILQNELFHKKPPKSFDRDDFSEIISPINNLKVEDALATFAYMHAKAININLDFLAEKPQEIFVCGGGRKNTALMDEMKKHIIGSKIRSVEEIGLNGDAVEAEAFAFLAIRSLLNLPISFRSTTGVSANLPNRNIARGGILFKSDFSCK